MSYLMNNVNHIVNLGPYVLPTWEVILFNYVGSRNIGFFSLTNNLDRIYLEKIPRFFPKYKLVKLRFPNPKAFIFK